MVRKVINADGSGTAAGKPERDGSQVGQRLVAREVDREPAVERAAGLRRDSQVSLAPERFFQLALRDLHVQVEHLALLPPVDESSGGTAPKAIGVPLSSTPW